MSYQISDNRQKISKTPTVSVLMPVYNAQKYVAEAVESILNQTFRDFEFLIIDDGSSDGSLAILKHFERDAVPSQGEVYSSDGC